MTLDYVINLPELIFLISEYGDITNFICMKVINIIEINTHKVLRTLTFLGRKNSLQVAGWPSLLPPIVSPLTLSTIHMCTQIYNTSLGQQQSPPLQTKLILLPVRVFPSRLRLNYYFLFENSFSFATAATTPAVCS